MCVPLHEWSESTKDPNFKVCPQKAFLALKSVLKSVWSPLLKLLKLSGNTRP
jgi:hypothetical protein